MTTTTQQRPARVEDLRCLAGEVQHVPTGWFRTDRILRGEIEIGRVLVNEAFGRIQMLSECLGDCVTGRDVEWIAKRFEQRRPAGSEAATQTASSQVN